MTKMLFIPVDWMERIARSGGMCRAFETDQEERRWFDRRTNDRDTPDRRDSVEETVHDFLLDFCSPTLRARLENKFESIPIARESARFAKAA